jgi:anti-sigma factor RsiW
MADNPVFERFREISWRRALTDAEHAELEAWLSAYPEFRAEWEAEMALSTSLAQLPEPAVSSNFTARVLQGLERDLAAGARPRVPSGWWEALTRKARWVTAGTLAVFAILVGFGVHQRQIEKQHELALADRVKMLSKMPSREVLENFETIRALNQAPAPDDKLLALLE